MATAAHKTLALTSQRLEFLRKKVLTMKYSVLSKFSYYRQLIFRSKQILNKEKQIKEGLSRLLNYNAEKLGISVESIVKLIKDNSIIKKSLDNLKLIAESDFIQREVIIKLMAALTSEILVRQDKFIEEFPHVLFNMTAVFAGTTIASAQTYRNIKGVKGKRKFLIWPNHNEPFVSKEFFTNWGKSSTQLLPPIAWMAGLLNGGLLLHQGLIKGEKITSEDMMKAVETFAWMIIFIPLAPVRSQLLGNRINPAIDRFYLRYPKRRSPRNTKKGLMNASKWSEDIKVPVSIGNSMIGGLTFTSILRKRGIQSNETDYNSPLITKKDLTYIYHDLERENANYLFPVILGPIPPHSS